MDNGGYYGHLFPGERFAPLDDELVFHYLKPRVNGEQVPDRGKLVFDCDLYGEQSPSEIWERFSGERPNDLKRSKCLYFFSPTTHKTEKCNKMNRGIKTGGTWKEDRSKKVICPETSKQIACRKSFSYKKPGCPHHGKFNMHEIKLDPSQLLHKNQKNDTVICVLRKKDDEPGKKRKQQEEQEDNEAKMVQAEDDVMPEEAQQKRPRHVVSSFTENHATTGPELESCSFMGNPNLPQVQFGDQNLYGMPSFMGNPNLPQVQFDDQNYYGTPYVSGQLQFGGENLPISAEFVALEEVQEDNEEAEVMQVEDDVMPEEAQEQRPRHVVSSFTDNRATTGPALESCSFMGNPNLPQVHQNFYGMPLKSSSFMGNPNLPQVQFGDQNYYGTSYVTGQLQFGGENLPISSEFVSLEEEQNQYFQSSCPDFPNVDQPVSFHGGGHEEILGEQCEMASCVADAEMQHDSDMEQFLALGLIDVHTCVKEFVAKDSNTEEEILRQQSVIGSCGGDDEMENGTESTTHDQENVGFGEQQEEDLQHLAPPSHIAALEANEENTGVLVAMKQLEFGDEEDWVQEVMLPFSPGDEKLLNGSEDESYEGLKKMMDELN